MTRALNRGTHESYPGRRRSSIGSANGADRRARAVRARQAGLDLLRE